MMLKVMKAIEDTVSKYSDDYRFINDHELNVVCQIDTDEERIEIILAAIDEQLPAGIYFSHEYTCGEYEITFKKIKGDDIMNPYVRTANMLDVAIQVEFAPLDWADQTLDDDGIYMITFTGPCYSECCDEDGNLNGIKLLALQDGFFSKIHNIKRMIENCGFTVLAFNKYEATKNDPWSEANITIDLTGVEYK